MMIHAAIDRIEDLLGSHRKVTWKRFQRGSHWIGQVCPMEEYDVRRQIQSHYSFDCQSTDRLFLLLGLSSSGFHQSMTA